MRRNRAFALTGSVANLDARQQLLAFACASHPRCGATSAARSLWLHGPSLAIAVRDACCVREASVRRDPGCGGGAGVQGFCLTTRYGLITFGISPVLLGVTRGAAVTEWCRGVTDWLVGCDRVLRCREYAGRDLVLCDRRVPPKLDCGTAAKVVMKREDWAKPDALWRITNNERWMILCTEGKIVVFDLWCDEPRESRVTVSDTVSGRAAHCIWSKYILDEVVLLVPEGACSANIITVNVSRTFTEKRLCITTSVRSDKLPAGHTYESVGDALHMKGEEAEGVECVVGDNVFGIVHIALPGGKLQYLKRGFCSLSQLNRHQFCIQSFPRQLSPLFEVWDCRNVTAPLSSIETPEDFSVLGGSGFLFSTAQDTLTVTEASSGLLILTLSLSSHITIHKDHSYL